MLLCCRTSSQISPVHNTKQNKCPLLIKPHNKCRPFVFPFILSTASGGRVKGGNGRGAPSLTLRAKKVTFLLPTHSQLSPSSYHTPLIVVVLVSFTCAGDPPATHLHILKFIINNAATTGCISSRAAGQKEAGREGRGRGRQCACGRVWVH